MNYPCSSGDSLKELELIRAKTEISKLAARVYGLEKKLKGKIERISALTRHVKHLKLQEFNAKKKKQRAELKQTKAELFQNAPSELTEAAQILKVILIKTIMIL